MTANNISLFLIEQTRRIVNKSGAGVNLQKQTVGNYFCNNGGLPAYFDR